MTLDHERSPAEAAPLVHAACRALRAHGATRVVAGSGCVLCHGLDASTVADALEHGAGGAPTIGKEHVVPTVYDGEDLDEVARSTGLARAEVIRRHHEATYGVDVVGFMPGFAYLRGLHPSLVVARRGSPRPRVPAGSVAVAGDMTGVYPAESPGGWHLLGTTDPSALFDVTRSVPPLFTVGDRVRFQPVTSLARVAPPTVAAVEPGVASLVVEQVLGCVTIQDAGRPHAAPWGVPPSGFAAPTHARRANVSLGNSHDAPIIEVLVGRVTLRTLRAVTVSVDGETRQLPADDVLVVDTTGPGPAVHAVAFSGGIDVLRVMDSGSTLLGAAWSPMGGRPLRKGMALGTGRSPGSTTRAEPAPALDDTVFMQAGPHPWRFPPGALDALVRNTWHISPQSNRVGTRLVGTAVPRAGDDRAGPVPMIRGAVQVTTDGTPIVLGPDHPVTGGYPVVAVVTPAGCEALALKRPGDEVRFRLADPARV